MKNRIWSITLLVSLLLLAVLPAGAQPAPGATAIPGPLTRPHINSPSSIEPSRAPLILRGRVVDSASQPQAGFIVQALLPSGRLVAQAQTSPEGVFVLAKLPQHAIAQPLRLQTLDSSQQILPLSPASMDKVSPAESQRPVFHELVLAASKKDSLLPSPASLSPAGIQATGQITGTVIAEDTLLPLNNISVFAYDESDMFVGAASTVLGGKYTIGSLDPGSYRLWFVPYGTDVWYLQEWYDDKASLDEADPVVVASGGVTANINATLSRGAGITGTVTAEDSGLPISDVSITLYDLNGDYVDGTSVNAQGIYTFTALVSGTYYMRFYPHGDYSQYIMEYYNDQPNLQSADPITVTAPVLTTGINASLALGGLITGKVIGNDTGQGLPDVTIEVYDCYGFAVAYGGTDASGVYTVTGLIPGDYRLGYFPDYWGASRAYLDEYYNDKPSLDGAETITVASGQTVAGVDAVLGRGGQITGKITAADSSLPLEGVEVQILDSNGDYLDYATTEASGVYTTPALVSGSYLLKFMPWYGSPAKDYVQEFYNDKLVQEDASLVQVTQPNLTTGIDAALARGGKISGRVTVEGSSAGMPFVFVDAYHPQYDLWVYNYTDAAGNYTVSGLPDGAYKVGFDPYSDNEVYVAEYYDDTLDWNQAVTVTVTAPAETTGIDAQLALGGKIECNVRAEDTNLPLEGAYVTAYDSQEDYRASDWTNLDGDCLLQGLPSDDYTVYFDEVFFHAYDNCQVTTTLYVAEFYDDKPAFDSADPITVIAPNTVTGINALLSVGELPPPPGSGDLYMPLIIR